jgi:hypothetical protein
MPDFAPAQPAVGGTPASLQGMGAGLFAHFDPTAMDSI